MNQSLLAPHRILKSRRRGYVSIIAFVDTTTTTSCPTVHLLATVDLAVTGSLRWQVDHTSHRLRKGIVLGWTPPAVLEHLMA
ncbi:hypothetical protein V6Z88_006307 [Aspergillus fumigatus]